MNTSILLARNTREQDIHLTAIDKEAITFQIDITDFYCCAELLLRTPLVNMRVDLDDTNQAGHWCTSMTTPAPLLFPWRNRDTATI
jgi:hypothetical protein